MKKYLILLLAVLLLFSLTACNGAASPGSTEESTAEATEKKDESTMKYKYQMHAHTYPCSKCGKWSIEELVETLHAGGYQGCVITNHFLHGNTGIDKNIAWAEFVKEYEDDYLRGKACAEKYDFDLLFGLEEGLGDGLEILCYGVTPQMLYDHPELAERRLQIWYEVLSANGAIVLQAHPFRTASYIPTPRLLPEKYIDGIEVFNLGNDELANFQAEQAAETHPEWILVSGADTHSAATGCVSGIAANTRITDEKALADLLKSGQYQLIKETQGA